jgi:hypothetical protein
MTKAQSDKHRSTMVPVTTMEEIPVLSDDEQAALLRSLREAEEGMAAGEGVDYEPAPLRDHLMEIHRTGKRS